MFQLFLAIFTTYLSFQVYSQTCNPQDLCIAGQCPDPTYHYCDTALGICCTGPVTTAGPSATTASSFNCVDTEDNCSQYLSLCSNINYAALLSKYCRKTCGMCGPNCKDQSSECTVWNSASDPFCTDSFYKNVTCYCAKTCGLCNAPCG
uniref:ShKT domain-containing protein n=1 Tax=Acrobeloides nanus TaxID=290746 RepID=A0A914DMA8_9BILA